MSVNSLKEYGDLFERLGLSELSVEDNGFKLVLKKNCEAASAAPAVTAKAPESANKTKAETVKPEAPDEEPARAEGEAVTAPLLGIFYANADGKEAVKTGDTIKKGDVLCTIEAMKMMNEVRAPKDGVVLEVLAKDGDLVEFKQELFIIG